MNSQSDSPKVWPARLRKLLFLLVLGVTIVALASAVEYWRASSAWKTVQEDIRKRGEPLTYAELVGPPVPAEQNFAEIPLFQGLFNYKQTVDDQGRPVYKWTGVEVQRRASELLNLPPERTKNIPKGQKSPRYSGANLESLATAFRGTNTYLRYGPDAFGTEREMRVPYDFPRPPAEMEPAKAVLFALEARKDLLAEIAQGVRRPYSQFAARYEDGALSLIPHLGMFKSIAILFRARAAARLATGDASGAAEDVESIFLLGERTGNEGMLIGYLVRIAVDTVGVSAFWSGAITHAWNEQQLAAFQARFEAMEYKTGLIRGLRGERLLGAVTIENLIGDRSSIGKIFDEDGGGLLMQLIPSFWLRQNQVLHSRILDRGVEVLQGARGERTFSSQKLPDVFRDFAITARRTPYNVLVHLLVPGLSKSGDKADRALVVSKLAACVCALERHRLATGKYPQTLSELSPRFVKEVPIDPSNDQPFRYTLNADGTFTLYGVGPDQKDDGAPGDKTGDNKGQLVDWVWPPAGPTEEIRLF